MKVERPWRLRTQGVFDKLGDPLFSRKISREKTETYSFSVFPDDETYNLLMQMERQNREAKQMGQAAK